jgi:hypothetical protein
LLNSDNGHPRFSQHDMMEYDDENDDEDEEMDDQDIADNEHLL